MVHPHETRGRVTLSRHQCARLPLFIVVLALVLPFLICAVQACKKSFLGDIAERSQFDEWVREPTDIPDATGDTNAATRLSIFGAAVQAAIVTGEGSSQLHDLLLFGRHSFAIAFGDGSRCHHGAHRTQHFLAKGQTKADNQPRILIQVFETTLCLGCSIPMEHHIGS